MREKADKSHAGPFIRGGERNTRPAMTAQIHLAGPKGVWLKSSTIEDDDDE